MKRITAAISVGILMSCLNGPAWADDKEATAVLDKAIKAIGGEEKLGKTPACFWKTKGTITFGGNESKISTSATLQGLDRYHSEFEGDFGGNEVKGVTVVDGDKGWRKFNDMSMALEGDMLANEKRNLYLTACAALLVPMKGKGFKVESAGEEKVGDKPAAVLKVTGPDGKDFKIFFDKESGLVVKQTATVAGFNGEEFTQESVFSDYKDFGGIKKATKHEIKRNGETFLHSEITDFKLLDKVDDSLFKEPV